MLWLGTLSMRDQGISGNFWAWTGVRSPCKLAVLLFQRSDGRFIPSRAGAHEIVVDEEFVLRLYGHNLISG